MEWCARRVETKDLGAPYLEQLPSLIRQVLSARGFTGDSEIQDWLSPKLKNLRDPACMVGMEQATSRLAEAFVKKEPVCIYADFDLDGTSGLALLKCGMEALGFADVRYYQPRRLSEGYGVHPEAIEKIAQGGCKLIVTVDVGITAFAAADKARELGADLIVTDHHLPYDHLPQALVVVNPNQEACRSQLGHLSGAGVAYYLLLSVRRELSRRQLLPQEVDLKEVLDFYVIGTLTDLVPLVAENRVLVKHGLLQLARTRRAGLRALLDALEMSGRALTSADVAIKFAPKLNALSRMEQGILPIDLLLVEDLEEARRLVRQVLATNQIRQQLQAAAEKDAFSKAVESKNFIWVHSPDYHKGVIGLVATKLAKTLHLPAFVGHVSPEGVISGSARAPDGGLYNLPEILASASEVLERYGGHKAAAGFELSLEKADRFRELVADHLAHHPLGEPPPLYYDGEGRLIDVNDQFLKWFEHLEPFGVQFESPQFLIRQVQLGDLKVLNGGHLRLTLHDPLCPSRQAIWFSPKIAPEVLDAIKAGERFDLMAQASWNHFRGQKTFQLLVQDLRLC